MRHLNAGIWNSFANPIATNSQESISHTDLISGYTDLVEQRVQDGWQPYLITFMFKRLPGNKSSVIKQMRDEIERVYATLVTRVVRKPRSPKSADRLPVLIGFADLPVPKREKEAAQGDRAERRAALPRHPVDARAVLGYGRALPFHFMKYRRLYVGHGSRLDRLHAAPDRVLIRATSCGTR